MGTFTDLIESSNIMRAIEAIGYEKPTTIQTKAIPLLKEGVDMIAKSNTGTGKTAAFGLPILENIEKNNGYTSIILCPTRELAMQANDELLKFSKYMQDVRIACVYGGSPIANQIKSLKRKPQIIVGTPGRVLDHMRRKSIRLNNCNCVVLDEADEMLNMGFRDDIEMVLNAVEEEHQTVLFSATMPKEIRDLANRYLNDPQEIHVQSKQKTVDKITQHYYDVKQSEKPQTIRLLLGSYDPSLSIIFCNTKARVDDLVEALKRDGVMSMGLHGDIRQEKRTKIMQTFKKAKKAVLVASDVAARGIDVNNIDLVINYDLPQENETYVHRIGRTGRAGKEGMAITLVQSYKQKQQLKQIMRYTNANIEKKEVPTMADVQTLKKEKFRNKVIEMAQHDIKETHLQFANELMRDGLTTEEILNSLIQLAFGGQMPSASEIKEQKAQQAKQADQYNNDKPKSRERSRERSRDRNSDARGDRKRDNTRETSNTKDASKDTESRPSKSRTSDKPVKKKELDLELKFGLGKSKNITKDDIENAILKKCSVDKEDIYKVDVRKHYTIVSLHPKCAAQVMEYMNRTKINDKRCEVYPYKKAKDKAPKNKS